MKRSLQKMLKFSLIDDSAKIKPSRIAALYAAPDSWFLAMVLFQRAGSSRLEYTGIKDLVFDWDLLECRKTEGAGEVDPGDISDSFLELRGLISSFIVLDNINAGIVRDAVIDETNLHIEAFLVDYMENEFSRTLFLESEWCSWSRKPETPLMMKVPYNLVRRFLE
jgi:hypothetical protein